MKTNLAYVADPNHKRKYEGDWPTLPKMLHNSAQSFADNLCFTVLDPENPFSMTYKEVLTSVQRLSSMLTHDLNVQAGDNIALCGANSPEWGIAFFAIIWSGATVIPLDATASIEKNNSLAKRADVRFVIGDEEFFKEGFGSAYSAHNLCLNKTHPRYILEMSARKELAEVPTYNNEQLAAILFTSGTTGMEKGVMLTHRNLVSDAYCLESLVSYTPRDMFYAILPIHHTYCMQSSFIAPLTNGASIAFAKGIVISQMMKELALNKITVIAGIPLLFNKLLQGILDGVRKKGVVSYGLVRALMAINALSLNVFNKNMGKKLLGFVLKKANLQGVNLLISGGGPIPPTTIKLFNHLGVTCVQGYGLTETSPIVTLNPVNRNKHKSIGLPIDLTDIIIHNVDNDGNGEIAVKGPMVFEGYYHNPEATADAFTSEGYFKTGDLGYIDPDGYVYITGRSKNIIVTEGGKNVSPEEVEDIFQLTPEFEQVMVRGYLANAETQSEGIEVLVYPNKDLFKGKSEAEITESILELIRTGNKRLSSYQRIGQVRLLDQPMELTGTKKIRRHTVDKDAGKIIM